MSIKTYRDGCFLKNKILIIIFYTKVDPPNMSSIYDIYPYVIHNQYQQSEQIIKFPKNFNFFLAIKKQ
jgi:hypothetical protein